ncbi:MAG: hypothetical protein MPJ50_10300 [Pirellulales bacterium]|nr:hypothetical protein [Pirellulales bacterium]
MADANMEPQIAIGFGSSDLESGLSNKGFELIYGRVKLDLLLERLLEQCL